MSSLLIVAIAAAFYGLRLTNRPREESLLGARQLSARDIAQAQKAFEAEQLHDYEIRDNRIYVPSDRRVAYGQALAKHDASPGPGQLDKFLDGVVQGGSFWEGRQEKEDRKRVAEERLVAAMVRGLGGIDDALVHFDEVELGGLRRAKQMKAMVAVWPQTGVALDAFKLSGIRQAVTGWKAGLLAENVTVFDGVTGHIVAGSTDAYELAKAVEKHHIEAEIASNLRFIPGVEIEANIELRKSVEVAQNSESTGSPAETDPHYVPSRITVSIGVPNSYYRDQVTQQMGAAASDDPAAADRMRSIEQQTERKVKDIVQGLTGSTRDTLADPDIRVTVFRQIDHEQLAASTNDLPLVLWVQTHTPHLAITAVLLMAFVLCSGMLFDIQRSRRKSAAADGRSDLHVLRLNDESADEPMSEQDPEDESEPSMGDDSFLNHNLTDLVREDPTAAAAVLRSWVERAG